MAWSKQAQLLWRYRVRPKMKGRCLLDPWGWRLSSKSPRPQCLTWVAIQNVLSGVCFRRIPPNIFRDPRAGWVPESLTGEVQGLRCLQSNSLT